MLRLVLIFLFSFTAMGQMVRVAILDTGIDLTRTDLMKRICPEGPQNYSGASTSHDFNGHGTNIASIILDNAPSNVCITPFKVFDDYIRLDNRLYLQALKTILEGGYEYVNMSMEGAGTIHHELNYLYDIADAGAKISIAAGNYSTDLRKNCKVYPACYFDKQVKLDKNKTFFNVHVVGASDLTSSNRGVNVITNWETGKELGTPRRSGTSQAAARHTNLRLRGYYN